MENNTYKSYKKIRKTWNINPIEQVKESVYQYNRNAFKEELRRTLNQLDEDDYTDEYAY